jgi:PAS domain S-box-containing protein
VFKNPDFAAHVADTVREPLLVLDGDLRILAANRAFYRTFGVSAEETHGITLGQVGRGQWSDATLGALLRDLLSQQVEFEEHEVIGDFPGLGTRVMSLSGRQILGAESGGTILLALEDITERRAIEEALALRSRQLEASNLELEQFASVASHDLQEPLRKIRTYGDLLRKRHAEALDETALDYIERMWQASGRMQVLIDDLLSLSRITVRAGATLPVDLNRVVREVLVDLEIALRESGGAVEVDELPTVLADPTQMRQLFQNLLSNAVKFRRREVTLQIHVTAATLPGVPPSMQPAHEIVVQDNGIGFAQRYADKIFAPFARLHARSEYSGTGIGLAICRRIVERHRGTIVARSDPDTGTAFTIALPDLNTLARPEPSR